MTQLHGAWPTMVTPFDENLKIDSGAYRAIIQWYLTHKIGGLYANCLSSEMYHLSNAERLTGFWIFSLKREGSSRISTGIC